MNMKRKELWVSIILIAVLLIVSACGNAGQNANKQEAGGNAAATAQPTADATEEPKIEAGATREYKHMAGTSVIPAKPERVVTNWYYGQLVALGLKPVGTDDYVLNNHPFIEKEGTESIGQSLEKIIELEPDLIISWGADKYEDYSKIAPTLPLELSGGPIETVRIFGDILGREQEAEDWIAAFEANNAAARAKLAETFKPEETVTILTIFKKELRVYGFVNMGGYALYEALQVKPPAKVDELFRGSEEWNKTISFEVLPEYAGDHIILTVYEGEEDSGKTLKELQESAVWNSLEAVKNGHVHQVPFNNLYNDDPVAIEHQVKLLTELLAK
jgi:iron complex transport system substrate-binding protein